MPRVFTRAWFPIAIFVLSLIHTNTLCGMGVHFFNGNWKQALQKAKEENKIIFVQATASWCGPCRKMAATTLKDPSVASVYNQKFINVKMDIDSFDGYAFRLKYNVKGVPDLLFINPAGELVFRDKGSKRTFELIDIAYSAEQGKENSNFSYELAQQFKSESITRKPVIGSGQNTSKARVRVVNASYEAPINRYAKRDSEMAYSYKRPAVSNINYGQLSRPYTKPAEKKERTVVQNSIKKATPLKTESLIEQAEKKDLGLRYYFQSEKEEISIAELNSSNQNKNRIETKGLDIHDEIFRDPKSQLKKPKLFSTTNFNREKLATYQKKYVDGNRKTSFLREFAYELKKFNLPTADITNKYLNLLRRRGNVRSARSMDFILEFADEIDTHAVLLLIARKKAFEEKYGKKAVNDKIRNAVLYSVGKGGIKKDKDILKRALSIIKKAQLPDEEVFTYKTEVAFYETGLDWKNYTRVTKGYMKNYRGVDAAFWHSKAWDLLRVSDDRNDLKLARKWVETSMTLDPQYYNFESCARILEEMGKVKLGLYVAKDAVKLGKEKGKDVSRAEAMVERFEKQQVPARTY